MPKFWQSIRAPASSRQEQKTVSRPVVNPDSIASPCTSTGGSRCVDQATGPFCRPMTSSTSQAPFREPVAVTNLPIQLPDQQDPHVLFRPGWNFGNVSSDNSLPGGDSVKAHQQRRYYAQPFHQMPAEASLVLGQERQEQPVPLRSNQQSNPAYHGAMRRPPPLRTVASSPSLSTRKDSKTSPVTPSDHPAFRARNASYNCPTSANTLYDPLPFPPMNKPLPPIPTIRQNSNPELPTISELAATKTPSSPSQRFEYSRAPPPYIEAQLPALSHLDGSKTDPLSPRTKIVMEVLGHIVLLLKTQDQDSLMEFSNLVTSQTRALHLDTQKDFLGIFPVRF